MVNETVNLYADGSAGKGFLQDYLSVQFDLAHLLSEMGFEVMQAVVIYIIWRKFVRPRWFAKAHRRFDETHGLTHNHQEGDDHDSVQDLRADRPGVRRDRGDSVLPVARVCPCPHMDTVNGPGTGIACGYTSGCPVHLPPGRGCPNPECGETWVKSFKGTHCESCGWTQEIIEEQADVGSSS